MAIDGEETDLGAPVATAVLHASSLQRHEKVVHPTLNSHTGLIYLSKPLPRAAPNTHFGGDMKTTFKILLAAGISTFALGTADRAFAQDETPMPVQGVSKEEIKTSNEIVVNGGIGFRNRTESTEPVLVYDTDYFQRFEPLTAGDALKRVPSVTFLSDVIESDGARLRGLDPGYTQILINGDKVPGGQVDRSFFLDRIPAELIKQVEIVRSSSARRSGDAVAGSLNIVLRDGYQLDGGYVRAGGLHFDDGEIKPSLGAVWGGKVGPGRLLIGANLQGRYNPKEKLSLRFDEPGGMLLNREDQTDTRDGTDYSANVSYDIDLGTTKIEFGGFYVRTDRTETERSFEYNKGTGIAGPVPDEVDLEDPAEPLGLLTDNSNIDEIDQENYSLTAKLKQEWSLGKTTFKAGFARFWNRSIETENEIDFNRSKPRFTGDITTTRIVDKELSFGLDHEFEVAEDIKFVVGGFFQNKDRNSDIQEAARQRFNLTAAARNWDQFSDNPDSLIGPYTGFDYAPGGFNKIEEDRRDGFAQIEGKSGIVSFEAGIRYEHTKVRIADLDAGTIDTNDYGMLLPSASAKIELTAADRITISGARTNRRPRLDYLAPVLLEEEVGDSDLLGNPNLQPEKAWGFDLGYEHRIGRTGVIGVNVFYRNIKDLVELANIGGPGSGGAGTFIYQPQNVGDGEVYGIEFDLSTDLGFIGLKDTGIFGNFSYLESDITDVLGERRFNGQSKYVYNFGAIQNIPSIGAAFGATYRKQGAAYDRVIAEEVTTTYGADLELFVEKRFGNWLTIRAVGSNLLNGRKNEVFNKFDNLDDQIDRDFDEYELESEKAGPVFQLIARAAF